MQSHPWYLLPSGPGDPAFNMALDEALLEAAPRLGQPVLRFYSWTEPAASFGYFQRYAEIERLTPLRPLVRRPTGGGLVPHDADWTYSLAFPPSDEWYRLSATESYRRVHEWIQRGLRPTRALPPNLRPLQQEPCPANASRAMRSPTCSGTAGRSPAPPSAGRGTACSSKARCSRRAFAGQGGLGEGDVRRGTRQGKERGLDGLSTRMPRWPSGRQLSRQNIPSRLQPEAVVIAIAGPPEPASTKPLVIVSLRRAVSAAAADVIATRGCPAYLPAHGAAGFI